MKKPILFSLSIMTLFAGLNSPVFAQWDLNGTGANTPMGSANAGGIGYRPATGGNGVPMQTYNQGTNAMTPSQYQASYAVSQYGNIGIPNSYTTAGNPLIPQLGGGGLLPTTSMTQMSPMQAGKLLPLNTKGINIKGLPPTSLDSFVLNAGGNAEAIYGDEGTNSWPPLSGFGPGNTINAGIVGQRSKTMTTGNGGNMLPTASGNGQKKSP
jgi:hypothetical protein